MMIPAKNQANCVTICDTEDEKLKIYKKTKNFSSKGLTSGKGFGILGKLSDTGAA